MKPMRLATNNNYPERHDIKTLEYLEINDGYVYWKGTDNISDLSAHMEFSFPVDLEFIEDFFKNIGRKLDKSKLPQNLNLNPYGI